jgi:hypothetical protein
VLRLHNFSGEGKTKCCTLESEIAIEGGSQREEKAPTEQTIGDTEQTVCSTRELTKRSASGWCWTCHHPLMK